MAQAPTSKQVREQLKALTKVAQQCLDALDAEMAKPSSPERGQRIAAIANALNLQNSMARRFGLGER